MLNKRAQILFDQDLWHKLANLARSRNTSVGELVRLAVWEKYEDDAALARRAKAVESTLQGRLISGKKIDYRKLIDYGRKF